MDKSFQINSDLDMMLSVNNKLLMVRLSFTTLNSTTSDKITQLFLNVQTTSFSNLIQVLLTSQDPIIFSTPTVLTVNLKLMLTSLLLLKETLDGSVVVAASFVLV